jgi:hypothetical protein
LKQREATITLYSRPGWSKKKTQTLEIARGNAHVVFASGVIKFGQAPVCREQNKNKNFYGRKKTVQSQKKHYKAVAGFGKETQ